MSALDDYKRLPTFCSISETATFLDVSPSTVRRYIDLGYLTAWKLEGGRKKVVKDSIGSLCGIERAI